MKKHIKEAAEKVKQVATIFGHDVREFRYSRIVKSYRVNCANCNGNAVIAEIPGATLLGGDALHYLCPGGE